MNIIDNNSFLTKLAADETADEWQIPENLDAETPLDQNQIENFLSNFNIDATTIEKHSDQFVGLNGQNLLPSLTVMMIIYYLKTKFYP